MQSGLSRNNPNDVFESGRAPFGTNETLPFRATRGHPEEPPGHTACQFMKTQILNSRTRNRQALAITIGAIVASVLVIVGFRSPRLRVDATESTVAPVVHLPAGEKPGSAVNRVSPSQAVLPPKQASARSDTLERGKHLGPDPGINFGAYQEFMDSLVRKPTPAEEDAIIASSKRDPQVLLGLALTGSPRAPQFLRELLEKSPEIPLVHYGILRYANAGFDVLASAQKLVSLVPNDAELSYAAAAEAFKVGDRTLATDYLRKGAAQSEFATLHSTELAAKLDAYRLAGSSEEMAQTRVLLENNQTMGDVALFKLHEYLLSDGSPGPFKIAPGNEEMAALLLAANQKMVNTKGLTLDSYLGSRGTEIEYLKAFLRASVTGENPAAAQYLSSPASALHSTAAAEWQKMEPVLIFGNDKPGVYQRLSGDQQRELVERIQKDGEISAFLWANEVRPDIFHSPDFKPQGYSKKAWTEYLYRAGVPLSANRKR